jgi:hypothetical protein
MNVTDYKEIWQIDAGGQIYEAKFEEMAQWIFEGSLLPQDMVKRGNLRWIEARKVPALSQFFNAKERGEPPPVFASATEAGGVLEDQAAADFALSPTFSANSSQTTVNETVDNIYQNPNQTAPHPFAAAPPDFRQKEGWQQNRFSHEEQFTEPAPPFTEPAAHEFNLLPAADVCTMHPEMPAAFLCGTCGNGFCKTCPKSYGGSVKICPFCGAMCKSVKEVQEKTQAAADYERDISRGFGAEDFFNALAYPFKYKTSLLVGGFMFALFTIGRGAGSMGSILLVAAGLICWMMANMLWFGVLANTVENFAQGKIGGNFMPSFDDFSLWDDVVHPFFLSVGVYIVSFGLVILIVIVTIFWGLNQISNAISDSYDPANETRIVTDKNSPVRNSPAIKRQEKLYGKGDVPDEDDIERIQTEPGDTEETVREAQELINQQRKNQLENGFIKSPETEKAERDMFLKNLTNSPVLIMILLLVGIGWGIFYLPAACMVAAYTRSFVATLNPSIGLETIKLLGFDYVKIWFMGFALTILHLMVSFGVHFILSPLHLPTFGNIPAQIIDSIFWFYTAVVFSVILGFVLYKNADKMNLFKG